MNYMSSKCAAFAVNLASGFITLALVALTFALGYRLHQWLHS